MKSGKISVRFGFMAAVILLATACREEAEIFDPETETVTSPEKPASEGDDSEVRRRVDGFYLLNEGNMGNNKSTLDYFDCTTGEYHRNIYAAANPTVPKELGDVGNDLKIYGGKLYAVINRSNKVEVMDRRTAGRVGKIDIPNCRYIRFHGGYAYVTSYAGPVKMDPGYEQIGYVAKVDTATLEVVARCEVGYQPEELEIVDDKIYVANSGGYMAHDYENTVSVIDIATFAETGRIEVAINLHRLRADAHGNLWVTSRDDCFDDHSRLFWIDTRTNTCGGAIDVAVSNFCLDGDSLYFYSTECSHTGTDRSIAFGIVDVAKKKLVTRNFITDGTDRRISIPYGIMVHPYTKDIYLTDAGGYVYPGNLYCYDRCGVLKWDARTGDIPAHFALLYGN
ncbi:MAG: YncE family protein [Bacteroidales bacterium]|nr:YncE family protein [Bacteroidales bacterium]